MKLTTENAHKVKPGDYVRVDYGGGVMIDGAVYAVDVRQGLWLDRPDGSQRVHGPAIFNGKVRINKYTNPPRNMRRDGNNGHYKFD